MRGGQLIRVEQIILRILGGGGGKKDKISPSPFYSIYLCIHIFLIRFF